MERERGACRFLIICWGRGEQLWFFPSGLISPWGKLIRQLNHSCWPGSTAGCNDVGRSGSAVTLIICKEGTNMLVSNCSVWARPRCCRDDTRWPSALNIFNFATLKTLTDIPQTHKHTHMSNSNSNEHARCRKYCCYIVTYFKVFVHNYCNTKEKKC